MISMWTNIKRCKIFLTNCKKEIVIMVLLGLFSTAITTIIPSTNGGIINGMLDRDYTGVIVLAIIMGALHIFYTVFNMFISKNYLTFRKKLLLNIKRTVCRSILDFDIDVYSASGQGTIINKIKDDSKNIAMFLNSLKESIFSALANIGVLFYVFYLNTIIGLCYLVAIIILIAIDYVGIKKSMYYKHKLLEVTDENSTLIGEIIKGSKDIKTLKLKDKFIKKTDESFVQIEDYEYKSNIYMEYANKISSFMGAVFSGLVVIISIILIENNLLTVSNFVILFMYKSNIFNISTKLSSVVNHFKQFSLSVNRVCSVLDYKKEEFGTKSLTNCKGKITFKDVNFSYNKNLVLKNINLEINKNSFVVIAGKNGVGKTTLFSLLTKVLTPIKGNIYIDDIDLSQLSEESIRNNISLVTQQPYLFNFSIKENLDMIDDDMNHIIEACKLVGLHEKIEALSDGYDTILKEDGVNLSGGEKQKIAIARALLAKTKILLLDEITNNLDSNTISSIEKLIEKLKGKYTILLITHHLDMMKLADRIILLDNGSIVGDGDHKTLIKENKFYKEFYKGKR